MPGGVHEFMKAWDPEEDQIIIEMLERLGPKWSKIVQRLPGRTVSSVRNRWQRIDKGRRLREAGHESKNRCQQCGKPKRGHVCMARLKNRGETGQLAAVALKQWEHAKIGGSGADDDGEDDESSEEGEGEVAVPLPHVSRTSSIGSNASLGDGQGGGRPESDSSSAYGEPHALLAHLSHELSSSPSGTRSVFGFNALAAAAEAELRRTNSSSNWSVTSRASGSTVATASLSSLSVSRMSSSTPSVGEAPTLKELGEAPTLKEESDAAVVVVDAAAVLDGGQPFGAAAVWAGKEHEIVPRVA